MRDLIVQWLTEATSSFWKSSLSIDQFITALQETFHMVFFAMLFGCIWGFIQAIIYWFHALMVFYPIVRFTIF